MYNELYIIGAEADRSAMDVLLPAITAKGYTLNILSPETDGELMKLAIDYPVVALWLTPNASGRIFEIAAERNSRGIKTINIISDSMCLTFEQRSFQSWFA